MGKLTGKFVGSYVSENGNTVFRYEVSGTPEMLDAFRQAQGEYYREDQKTGKALYFTTRFSGDNVDLGIAEKSGKVYVDMSEFKKAESLVAQFGGNFAQELAKAKVAELMGNKSASATAQVPAADPSMLGKP